MNEATDSRSEKVGTPGILATSDIAGTLLLHDDQIAGFDQSGIEISVHVRMDSPVSSLTTAGVDAGYGSGITGQLRYLTKSLDIADLQGKDGC